MGANHHFLADDGTTVRVAAEGRALTHGFTVADLLEEPGWPQGVSVAAVWLADIVTIRARNTLWAVVGTDHNLIRLRSVTNGRRRRAFRGHLHLVEQCPDGPQLEERPDGAAFLAGELARVRRDGLLRRAVAQRPRQPAAERPLPVRTPWGNESEIQSGGGEDKGAFPGRLEVVDLARALLEMAKGLS